MKQLLSTVIVLLCLGAAAVRAGSIQMSAHPYSGPGVLLNITVDDTGGVSDCGAISIRRRAIYPCGGWESVACIERQVGSSRNLLISDEGVDENTSYLYEAVGTGSADCSGFCDQLSFQYAFDPHGWGFPIIAFATVGPDPTPIAHGRLVISHDATPDYAIESCSDACPTYFAAGYGDASVRQYIGTGTEVFLYGTVEYCCNCCGFLVHATSAEPHPCPPIAVTPNTWSNVKAVYR